MTRTVEGHSGRAIFAVGAVVAILAGGVLGAVVGANGQARSASLDLAGVVSVAMTPISMAAFGMIVTTALLVMLFGLVGVASRYDRESERPE